ncbi:MAG: hypothetical protein Q7T21_00375 [Gallionella sp.]|nr:hypothetical protein [Gallionella sp.]
MSMVLQEQLARQVPMVLMAIREQMEPQGQPDLLGQPALQVQTVLMVLLGQLELQVQTVLMVLLGQLELQVQTVLMALQEQLEPQGQRARQVPMV